MNMQDLLKQWVSAGNVTLSKKQYAICLSEEDAARLAALCDIFPRLSADTLIGDLLHFALTEVEAKLPYVSGTNITGHDEYGDPFFEDIGLTPRYMELVKKYRGEGKPSH
jgi:hypothetical protein